MTADPAALAVTPAGRRLPRAAVRVGLVLAGVVAIAVAGPGPAFAQDVAGPGRDALAAVESWGAGRPAVVTASATGVVYGAAASATTPTPASPDANVVARGLATLRGWVVRPAGDITAPGAEAAPAPATAADVDTVARSLAELRSWTIR